MDRIAWIVAAGSLAIGAGAGPRPAQPTRFPTVGVAFEEPAGWGQVPRDKGKSIGRWIGPGSTPRDPRALIMVDCGQAARDRTIEDLASGLAKDHGGKVDDSPTTLGGTRALRVRSPNEGRSLRPVEWIVALREGLIYVIIGGVTPGQSVAKELEAIRSSWAWIPIEPPYKHLEFLDRPAVHFGGLVSMNYPALMFSHPTELPERVLDLGLHNVVRNRSDFLAFVQLVEIAKGQTFDGLKDLLASELPKKYRMKGEFTWKMRGQDGRRFTSPTIDFEPPPETNSPGPTVPMKIALVNLDDRRIILVNFTLVAGSPEERSAYEALVDRIVDSVEVIGGAGGGGVPAKESR